MNPALFYEIPMMARFTREKENVEFNDTIEQAALDDETGFHVFWIVEHPVAW